MPEFNKKQQAIINAMKNALHAGEVSQYKGYGTYEFSFPPPARGITSNEVAQIFDNTDTLFPDFEFNDRRPFDPFVFHAKKKKKV